MVHVDHLLDGWDGLPGVEATLTTLLLPVREGRAGSHPVYDWHAERYSGRTHTLRPAPVIVVEGVGSGVSGLATLTTVLVWVEAERAVRTQRGLDRDGHELRDRWVRWQADEDALHARHRTRERADLVVRTDASVPRSRD